MSSEAPREETTDSNAEGGDRARAPGPGDRLCARVACGAPAVATLTADYDGCEMAVGPLSPERTPPALDLCAKHRDRLRPPAGWTLVRHDPGREPQSLSS